MDLEKIKNMSKDDIRKELERISSFKKTTVKHTSKIKDKKKPDYTIFEKPKSKKAEDYFSLEFLTELRDYIKDTDAKKTLIKMIKNKNDSDDPSSSDSD
jgi:hypothetical protein